MEIRQYEVFFIDLSPTVGHEIKKKRPCLLISPDEMNRSIQTVIVAPMTTVSHDYPSRIKLTFGGKTGWVVLDQIRTVDRGRLIKKAGKISGEAIERVKAVVKEMLVD
ncbi:MAG: type II toxin-antitoxin system PemK/MazF family toxin [Nitrospinae bacterium]|nr:type II toxin-antitoxin system PemK/MazF family toxin [Nitrospinota bacterium]